VNGARSKLVVTEVDTVECREHEYNKELANANIVLDHRDKVLTINESMLIFDKEHRFVEVQTGPQQFEKREVKLGLSDGIHAEVLSGVGEKDLLRKPVRAVATGTKI
jgi:hypothetical protein